MRTADFDFELPKELIAQKPASQRDASRLLVLHRSGRIEHRSFRDLADYLKPGDVLVLNNSRVIPARLRGVNMKTGGQFELLLLEELARNDWWVMMRPGKRAREGTRIELRNQNATPAQVEAIVVGTNAEGHRRLRFACNGNVLDMLNRIGEVPLPPYIERPNFSQRALDNERYQTVFAGPAGSVAAPTAGLHFTEPFLRRICEIGVQVCFVTLHVGLGTFAPVKSDAISGHIMHEERYEMGPEAAAAIRQAKAAGRRVVAVGTTTLRVLESLSDSSELTACQGRTRIFIYPPYKFKMVDMLLTNFHLPRSTLLMLVSAFAAPGQVDGRDYVLRAYGEAISRRYRFFSYGDAMLIV